MNFSLYDIVLVSIPFTDLTSSKVRPAVIVGFAPNGTDLFVAPGTSILLNADLILEGWREAGLNVPTGVKAQLATVIRPRRASEHQQLALLEAGV